MGNYMIVYIDEDSKTVPRGFYKVKKFTSMKSLVDFCQEHPNIIVQDIAEIKF